MQEVSNKKFSKYLLYAIGEIFLVVVGILIALQINNWNNQRLERNKEIKTYQGLRQQIDEDRSELVEMQAFNKIKMGELFKANEIISSKNSIAVDTLAYLIMMMSQYSDFHGNGKWFKDMGPIDPQKTLYFKFGDPLPASGKSREIHQQVVDFITHNLSAWGGEIKPNF